VPRVDGLDRARGQTQFTADIQLPGMLHTAVLRSPFARARVTSIDLDAARAARGVRAVVGPGELDVLQEEPGYVGHAVAAVAAETFGQAQAALEQLAVEWEALEPLLDPDEAVRQESFVSDVKTYERGDFERGVAEADVVVEAEYRTQVVLHNSLRRTRRSATGRTTASPSTSRRSTSGASATPSPSISACRPTRCASSATRWAAASARRTAPATTRRSRRSWRSARAAP
jgi:CO/xanthine dehydrogenase Mo-binding subunit